MGPEVKGVGRLRLAAGRVHAAIIRIICFSKTGISAMVFGLERMRAPKLWALRGALGKGEISLFLSAVTL
jgi:hypothetical protein